MCCLHLLFSCTYCNPQWLQSYISSNGKPKAWRQLFTVIPEGRLWWTFSWMFGWRDDYFVALFHDISMTNIFLRHPTECIYSMMIILFGLYSLRDLHLYLLLWCFAFYLLDAYFNYYFVLFLFWVERYINDVISEWWKMTLVVFGITLILPHEVLSSTLSAIIIQLILLTLSSLFFMNCIYNMHLVCSLHLYSTDFAIF